MRISDWSSDVCSSDLRIPAARQHAGAVNDADQRIGLREIAPQLAIAEIHVLGQQAGGGAVREHRFEQLARLIRPSAQVQSLDQPEGADVEGGFGLADIVLAVIRSEEHTSELQSLMRISYAVFCLKKTMLRI